MAIKINFDLANNPEDLTLILATRDGNKLGLLEAKQIELSEKLIGASEITFIINKYVDGRLTNLWDKIVDFKLVYCKDWDVWFEIRVEIDEDTKTVKTVFCTQLGQAELSQLMLYNIEINTEADIARDDYEISVLYDPDHPKGSILHRLFEKAPHYSFGNVDSTVAKIQRSFSFDDTSIYDALQEIAEEIGCLFVFHSGTDINGDIERFISVHDLEQYCNDCGHRGEFTTVCSKCGSSNMRHGYGEDTTIFVTADELASNNIQFTTDADSVKNCFKLEAGDDLMTATIRNCNPNGTDYIWYFSDSIKQDMSEALQKKLADYDTKYKNYHDNYSANLNSALLSKYNSIVNKYKSYNNELENIISPIKGYSNLMNAYYNVIDLSLYLESSMMPTVKMSETNATAQAELLTSSSLSPIAVTNIEYASVETVNSVALGIAKIFVKPTYKVEINGTSSLSDLTDSNTRTWKGSFVIANYSDEEDTATTGTITVTVNGDAELFTKQKIEKALNKADTEDYSIVGLFEKDLASFTAELKKYALKPLSSFRDACQSCIDILIEQGATKADLYDNLYLPYWNKLKAIEAEMKVREDEIAAIDGVYDEEGNLIKKGLATDIEKIKETIQDELDFEKYLGTDLWFEFSSYRREDKYKNENYISDGLNNAELFTRALEFIEVANNEIYKSSELQHSISSSLKNLMAIEKFKPLADHFEVGNWMRVQIDDSVYKLRLLEYTIDLDNFEDISVVFSDVSKVRNGISDLEDLFSQASSMTTHYDSVKKQANKGQEAQGTIEQWLQRGLNSALVRINNNDSEEVSMTQNGILCRSYDSLTDSYSPEQLKLTHNIMAYTNDDWMTVKQAIGKHEYVIYNEKTNNWTPEVGYGMSAEFVTAGQIMGATIVGGEIYSSNYSNGTGGSTTPIGTYINLQTGEFSFGGKKLVYDANKDTLTLSGVTIQWDDTNKPDVEVTDISGFKDYIDKLDTIENQVDGKAETWYQSTDPSVNWTTDDLKKEHIGDLWYYTGDTGVVNGAQRGKGTEWIWQNVSGIYKWCEMDVPDEVYDAIDGKSTVYTTVPSNPEVGDLLIPSSDIGTQYKAGKVYKYNGSTWAEISYTNDDALNAFINGTYADDLEAIQTQIDKKAETYYQSTDPSTSWTTNDAKNEHVGDLWYDTTNDVEYVYTKINNVDGSVTYQWVESTVDIPDEVYDLIDGKASIYVILPTNTSELATGDLLIPASNITNTSGTVLYTKGKVYRWTGSAWSEVAYTDDTAANEIKTGIAFTKINDQYVISPHIVGGDLNIVGTDGKTSAEITTDGILKAKGANIEGTITATSGSFTGDLTANSLTISEGATFGGKIQSSDNYGVITYWNLDSNVFRTERTAYDEYIGFGATNSERVVLQSGYYFKDTYGTKYHKGIVIHNNSSGADSTSYEYLLGHKGLAAYNTSRCSIIKFYDFEKETDDNSNYFTTIKPEAIRTKNIACDTISVSGGAILSGGVTVQHIQNDATYNVLTSSISGVAVTGLTSSSFVQCNGNFNVATGNITISSANSTDKPNAFKVSRSIYFEQGCGLYDYNTGLGIIHSGYSGGNKAIRVSDNSFITLLYGSTVYLKDTSTTVTSDGRLKTDIECLSKKHEDLFDTLRPVSFKYINGTSDRTHYGFIAQEVRDAALSVGMTTQDIAAFVSIPSDDDDMGEEYALRYDEFISLNTHMIQKCLKEIDSLKAENEILKQQLEEIKQSF